MPFLHRQTDSLSFYEAGRRARDQIPELVRLARQQARRAQEEEDIELQPLCKLHTVTAIELDLDLYVLPYCGAVRHYENSRVGHPHLLGPPILFGDNQHLRVTFWA